MDQKTVTQLKGKPSNSMPGPWDEVSKDNGIRVVKVSDFDVFLKFVNLGFGDVDCNYLWRGQRDASWEIVSTLSRTGQQGGSHLSNFRTAVARCSNSEYDISDKNPDAKNIRNQLWALGQHYGLSTPLIDWSIYPYVALFFAFVERDETPEFRAVYALSWHDVSLVNYHVAETTGSKPFRDKLDNPPYSEEFKQYLVSQFGIHRDDEIKMIDNACIAPPIKELMRKVVHQRFKEKQLHVFRSHAADNKRMHCQGGVHVYTPDDISVESWVSGVASMTKFPLLVKILIPNDQRSNIIKALNKMNINYLSLFPDHEGAAKYCNMALLENGMTLGFREY